MATITDLKIKVDTTDLEKAIELLKEYKSLVGNKVDRIPEVTFNVYETDRDFDFSGSVHDKIIEAIKNNCK